VKHWYVAHTEKKEKINDGISGNKREKKKRAEIRPYPKGETVQPKATKKRARGIPRARNAREPLGLRMKRNRQSVHNRGFTSEQGAGTKWKASSNEHGIRLDSLLGHGNSKK